MPIEAHIKDPESRNPAKVDQAGGLRACNDPFPPYGGPERMLPFRQFMQTPAGSSDMLVDGSSTNVDFSIEAHATRDRYICALSFQIVDGSATLSEFANFNSPLTNGCQLLFDRNGEEIFMHDALKTNWDFVRLCLGNPAFGDAAGAFRANNVSGASEGYIPSLDLRKTFGYTWGLKIEAGGGNKLTLRVRDNLTAAVGFDVIAYGFERIAEDHVV